MKRGWAFASRSETLRMLNFCEYSAVFSNTIPHLLEKYQVNTTACDALFGQVNETGFTGSGQLFYRGFLHAGNWGPLADSDPSLMVSFCFSSTEPDRSPW